MKITCISDTHSLHEQVKVPKCDLLIHAGDFTGNGSFEHLLKFVVWFSRQKAKYKVVIAGNHDEIAETDPKIVKEMFNELGIVYLENSYTTVQGIKIFGSPITPTFCDWHFMCDRKEIQKYWDKIKEGTDIVITHGPCHGILDTVYTMAGFPRDKVGDEALLKTIEKIKPKYHICGHIHCSYGLHGNKDTVFVNASSCNEAYEALNPPIEIEI